jgi:osomolarity two-component system response regulator SSK1
MLTHEHISLIWIQPVNFVWLERKVMEWGCMQALIDFDGWRKWKEISQEAEENEAAKKAAVAAAKAKSKKNRSSMTKPG